MSKLAVITFVIIATFFLLQAAAQAPTTFKNYYFKVKSNETGTGTYEEYADTEAGLYKLILNSKEISLLGDIYANKSEVRCVFAVTRN